MRRYSPDGWLRGRTGWLLLGVLALLLLGVLWLALSGLRRTAREAEAGWNDLTPAVRQKLQEDGRRDGGSLSRAAAVGRPGLSGDGGGSTRDGVGGKPEGGSGSAGTAADAPGAQTGTLPAPPPAAAAGLIDINRATAEQLDALPGIGPTRARAIVDYRKGHGPFRTKEQLQEVKGIGPATFAKLKDKITLGKNPPS